MKWHVTLGLTFVLLISTQPGHSTNLQWLKYSPVRYFNKTDWKLVKSTAREVLNNKDDNETETWENPDTGNSGSLEVTGTEKIKGQTCRKLKIINKANNLEGKAVYLFCQQADGEWKTSGLAPE